ncbi:hypothetical protein N7540_006340 [Penicillium herquei]|nr:hypothetical protein N7540_006340 [Penicillium herquei]
MRELTHTEFITCRAFKFPTRESPISDEWKDVFTVPVQVTNDRPCYHKSLGYKINARQSIAAFFSKVFPDPIEARLCRYPNMIQPDPDVYHQVIVGKEHEDSAIARIAFNRTVPILNDNSDYVPPDRTGEYPLFSTEAYRDKLPVDIVTQGGLFFPMQGGFLKTQSHFA